MIDLEQSLKNFQLNTDFAELESEPPEWEPTFKATGLEREEGEPFRVSIYQANGDARIWVQLTPDGIEECSHADIGNPAGWLDRELREIGLADVIGGALGSGYGLFLGRHEEALLRRGIAPEQPFLVEVGNYEVSYLSEGDWDAEWSAKIIIVQPLDPMEAGRRWAEWVHDERMFRLEREHREAVKKQRRYHERGAWRLHSSPYFAPSDPSYCDTAMPSGLALTLFSNLDGETYRLVSGRSDNGEHEEALRDLHAKCVGLGISVSMEELSRIPSRPAF